MHPPARAERHAARNAQNAEGPLNSDVRTSMYGGAMCALGILANEQPPPFDLGKDRKGMLRTRRPQPVSRWHAFAGFCPFNTVVVRRFRPRKQKMRLPT